MARTGDPHSATAQFFINTVDNGFLNHKAKVPQAWGYCVFGRVVEGMEVVRAIEALPTTTQGVHQNVPAEPAVIKSAKRVLPPTPAAPSLK
jgi:peptidyl-prolyl cis-trans isomerase B (cyclophilin B)